MIKIIIMLIDLIIIVATAYVSVCFYWPSDPRRLLVRVSDLKSVRTPRVVP